MKEKRLVALVVEDDVDMNIIICEALESRGFIAISCVSGIEALSLHKSYQPDVVLLDLMLPDIYGDEICRRIKASSSNSVIIIISARTDTASKLSSYICGARRFITKPFDVDILLHTVEAEVRQREYAFLQHRAETV